MEIKQALELLKTLKKGDLVEVDFNGATGIVRFIAQCDHHRFKADRWLDTRSKVRPNMKVFFTELRRLADPTEKRVQRAMKAFNS